MIFRLVEIFKVFQIMKLRIRGNSLRLRLLRGEVEQFGATGRVTETVRFGNAPAAQLSYVLEINPEVCEITADFIDNKVTVSIPEKTARNWIETELVTLTSEQKIEINDSNGAGENASKTSVLKILIEKDFVCLDRKNDPDNLDAFPHPTGKCA